MSDDMERLENMLDFNLSLQFICVKHKMFPFLHLFKHSCPFRLTYGHKHSNNKRYGLDKFGSYL